MTSAHSIEQALPFLLATTIQMNCHAGKPGYPPDLVRWPWRSKITGTPRGELRARCIKIGCYHSLHVTVFFRPASKRR